MCMHAILLMCGTMVIHNVQTHLLLEQPSEQLGQLKMLTTVRIDNQYLTSQLTLLILLIIDKMAAVMVNIHMFIWVFMYH